MAHALTQRASGFIDFAYAQSDGKAWHGLGQAVADGATLEDWQTAAGMDWRIQRGKVQYAIDREGTILEMPEQHVLFRSDTKAPLGIVSDGYQVVQPAETLEFFRDIAAAGGVEITAAGTLFGGRRFWATAKLGEAAPVSDRDRIGGYLLISSSADGSLSTEARFTTIRVVCNNTLSMARHAKAAVKVTHRSAFNPDAVKRQMGVGVDAWARFQADMRRLADFTVSDQLAADVLAEIMARPTKADPDLEPARIKARESRGFDQVMTLFRGAAQGSGLDGVRGTGYGLLNAVTEYVDHGARATSADNRFASAQWGPGAALKDAAFDRLLSMTPRTEGTELAALLAK